MMGPKPKMAKIDPLSAGADLLNLIALITDKDAVLSRLNEIETYTKQANEAVERVAKAKELDDLLNEAMATSAAIEIQQEKAKASSASIIAEAEARVAEIVAAAEVEAEKLKAEAKAKYNDIVKSQTEASNALIQEAENAKKDAEVLRVKLERELKEVNETKASFSKQQDYISIKQRELEDAANELARRESEVIRKESILRQL